MSIISRWRSIWSATGDMATYQQRYAEAVEQYVREQDLPQIQAIQQLNSRVSQIESSIANLQNRVSVMEMQINSLIANINRNQN